MALFPLLLLLCTSYSRASILASSRLTKCVEGTGDRDVGSLRNCTNKFVVALTANFGQNGTESLDVSAPQS